MNCYNCKHLEWVEAEEHDENGYCCNKRLYTDESKERQLLFNLTRESYLKKGKVCFEAKD